MKESVELADQGPHLTPGDLSPKFKMNVGLKGSFLFLVWSI